MLIQAESEAIQATIAGMQRVHLSWHHHCRTVEQAFNDLLLEMVAGHWQANLCNEIATLHPATLEAAQTLESLIGRLKGFHMRLVDADCFHSITPVIPPPRIYTINGINSDAPPGTIDDDAQKMKEYLANNTFIPPDQIVALTSVYNTNYRPYAFNTLIGATQVLGEYFFSDRGYYTQQIYAEIQADLAQNPLLPNQKIIIVAHSGGGAIAGNVVPMLEQQGTDVSNIVTLGSPATDNLVSSLYADNLHITEWGDGIGTPWMHSAITIPPLMPQTHSIEYDLIDEHSGAGDHGSYVEHDGAIESMATYIPEIAIYR